jgi:hypothetical protein
MDPCPAETLKCWRNAPYLHETMMKNGHPAASAHVALAFSPNVALISTVRRFVDNFFDVVLTDKEASSRMALTAHELLENACKYSIDGATTIRIEVTAIGTAGPLHLGAGAIRIRLYNRTGPGHIARLEKSFEEMRAVADPDAYYQKALTRAAKICEGSGLGLARLWAEADMRLSFELEGDLVCLIADTDVGARSERETTS